MRPKHTELQKAAERVAEINRAIKKSEEALVICQEDRDAAWLALREAERNLGDTNSLLTAQRQKLWRETNHAHELITQSTVSNVVNANMEDCGAKSSIGFPY